MNRVPQALAHLLVAVEPGQPAELRQQRLGLDQHLFSAASRAAAKHVVEPPDGLARKLEVRDLVLADGHEPRVIHETSAVWSRG